MLSLAKPRRIFLRYLLSYLVMFAIPILIMILLIYAHFIRIQRENVESAMRGELRQVSLAMDDRLTAMVESAAYISKDTQLTPYKLRSSVSSSRSGIERIGVYLGAMGFVDQILLITKEDGRVYTATGALTADTLIESGWYTLWPDIQEISVFPHVLTGVRYAGQSEPMALFCYPLPLLSSGSFGAVLYAVRQSLLSESLSTVRSDGDSFILDPSGRIVATSERMYIDPDAASEALRDIPETGVYERFIEGENYSLIVEGLAGSGWRCASLLPTRVFLSDVQRTQVILMLVAALLIMLGLSLAFYLSFSYYRPIEALYKLVMDAEQMNPGKGNFSELVDDVVAQDHRLMEKMDQSVEVLRENFFQTLIRMQRLDKSTQKRLMQLADIRLNDAGYGVCAIRVYAQVGNSGAIDELIQILKKLYESCHFGYVMGIRTDARVCHTVALLLNLRANPALEAQPLCTMQQLSAVLQAELGITPRIGVGSVVQDVEQIGASYTEALIACDQCPAQDCVCAFTQLAEQTLGEAPDRLDALRLIQYAKQGSLEMALCAYERVAQSLQLLPDARMYRMARLNLASRVAGLLGEYDKERNYAILDELVLELGNAAFDERIRALLEEICAYASQNKASNRTALAHDLISYVHAHSSDMEMSLTYLSEIFSLSTSTVNRLIKDACGQTFLEMLSTVRMEHARELLEGTDQKINEIVEQVGYQDIHSFIRKFKGVYGKTPGQYRKDRQEEEGK